MEPTKNGRKRQIDETLDELRALRDEVRLQLHLAGMEAKTKWSRELEPKLFALEKQIEREVTEATRSTLHDLHDAIRRFRASIAN